MPKPLAGLRNSACRWLDLGKRLLAFGGGNGFSESRRRVAEGKKKKKDTNNNGGGGKKKPRRTSAEKCGPPKASKSRPVHQSSKESASIIQKGAPARRAHHPLIRGGR